MRGCLYESWDRITNKQDRGTNEVRIPQTIFIINLFLRLHEVGYAGSQHCRDNIFHMNSSSQDEMGPVLIFF